MKDRIRDFLETLDVEGINKLSVFDFDGTSVDTGNPDAFKPIWFEKTGTEWPHRGWWGRKESLDMTVFDFKAKPEVMADYLVEKANKEAMVISLTGRMPKLSNEVEAILHSLGYEMDMYLYNYGGRTLENKLEQMSNILSRVPGIVHVELWDDRDGHISTFEQWGNGLVDSGRLESFTMNHVFNPEWTK